MIQLLRRIIPARRRSGLKRWRDLATSRFIRVVARSRILSAMYFLLFSRAFVREQQAILCGRGKLLQDSWLAAENQYGLRRNIHRIEKGLLMRPRRPVFALAYIEDTVHSYIRAATTGPPLADSEELKWASDVLAEYFEEVDRSELRIARAHSQFSSVVPATTNGGKSYVPHKQDLDCPPPVGYRDLLELARRRRSVRWYRPDPVPRDLIDHAVTLASHSPSACNRQPFEFRIFDDPHLVKRIVSIPMGTVGFSHNVPVIVAIVGKQRAFRSGRDRHIIYLDGALASMTFMFALETLGLSSCPINWPDIEELEKEMEKELKLERDERPIMLMSLGYANPDGMVAYSQRKMLDSLRRYN